MSSDTKDQLSRGALNSNKEVNGTENALDETGLYIIQRITVLTFLQRAGPSD